MEPPRSVYMRNSGSCGHRPVAATLDRGEEVEFPFGSLKKVHHAHKRKRDWFLNKIMTIYKKPNTVALEVDADGEKLLEGNRKEVRPPRAATVSWTSLQLPPRPGRL